MHTNSRRRHWLAASIAAALLPVATHAADSGTTFSYSGYIKLDMIYSNFSEGEVAMGVYMLECARMAMGMDRPLISVPFLLLFAAGYLYVGLWSLWSHWTSRRVAGRLVPQPG